MKPWKPLEEVFSDAEAKADDIPLQIWDRKELDARIVSSSRGEKSLKNRYGKGRAA